MRFDWGTLALQFVNVVVLIWLLSRFLFRPVADIIAARQATITRSLDDVATKQAQVDAERAAIEQTRAGFHDERGKLLAEAEAAAAREREAVLRTADTEAKERLAGADAMLARLASERKARMGEHALALATEIAAKLVSRLDAAVVRRAFADALVDKLEALPSTSRELLAGDDALAIVTPSPLPDEEADMIRHCVGDTIGGRPRVQQQVRPELLAGVELHGSQIVVRNSWQADLETIAAEIRDDRG